MHLRGPRWQGAAALAGDLGVRRTLKDRVFYLPKEAIDPVVAPGRGSCFATDMITVEGYKVAYMCREPPDNDVDSGCASFAGVESDDYANDPDNLALYSVNTIANYDPDIIPFLDAPVGSAFERDSVSGDFALAEATRTAKEDPDA